jgi:hypothetical protein
MRIEVLYVPGCRNYEPALDACEKSWRRNRCGTELSLCL